MNKDNFLKVVEDFLKKTNVSATILGLRALKDTTFVFRLRQGRECREKTQKQVLQWMSEYQQKQKE